MMHYENTFINPDGPNFLQMAHNFPMPWAVGSVGHFVFPIPEIALLHLKFKESLWPW